jgi:hypothetical protein
MSLLFVAFSNARSAQNPATVNAIKKAGGTVRRFGGNATDLEVEFHLRGRKLTDKGLAHIVSLSNVVSLNLRDTSITGAGLVHLKGLAKLHTLHLERTAVDDAGIAHLSGLSNLEYLNLYATNVTDKSLAHLVRLQKLRCLYVWNTGVTEMGIVKLEKALPGLKVSRGVDLSKLPTKYPTKVEPAKPKGNLKWVAITSRDDAPENSISDGNTHIVFKNESKQRVKVYWIGFDGKLKLYSQLAPGGMHRQGTYAKNAWLITDDTDKPLGYFVAVTAESFAVIPSAK